MPPPHSAGSARHCPKVAARGCPRKRRGSPQIAPSHAARPLRPRSLQRGSGREFRGWCLSASRSHLLRQPVDDFTDDCALCCGQLNPQAPRHGSFGNAKFLSYSPECDLVTACFFSNCFVCQMLVPPLDKVIKIRYVYCDGDDDTLIIAFFKEL